MSRPEPVRPSRARAGQRTGVAPADDHEVLFACDVLRALSSLDRHERDALRLIYFHRFTQDEVARALGVPRSTVSRFVAHGMHELSDKLLNTDPQQKATTS